MTKDQDKPKESTENQAEAKQVKITVHQTNNYDFNQGVDALFAKPNQMPKNAQEDNKRQTFTSQTKVLTVNPVVDRDEKGNPLYDVDGIKITEVKPARFEDLLEIYNNISNLVAKK